jgi:hypothetical protein
MFASPHASGVALRLPRGRTLIVDTARVGSRRWRMPLALALLHERCLPRLRGAMRDDRRSADTVLREEVRLFVALTAPEAKEALLAQILYEDALRLAIQMQRRAVTVPLVTRG